jgi:RHS repeat-associated protein
LSRLTSVTYPDNTTQTYTFDKVGNRLTKTEGTSTTTYTYNSVNELTSSSEGSYTYDANGNTLTGAQGRTYVWDQQNRLKQVTKNGVTTTFTYRSDGLRASKTVNGVTTHYVYDEQTVVGELRSDGTSSWYTPGPNGYISRTDLDSQGNVTNKEWFVYDGLGSCRAMVKPNAQGTEAVLVARYDYDVYGAVRTQSGSSANKFKYVASIGHPTDEETGLIYMRARYYDPQVGRFVSEDPGQYDENWFVYTGNNPVCRVDPTGLFMTFVDLLTDDGFLAKVEDMVQKAGMERWMQRKIIQALWEWAEKFDLLLDVIDIVNGDFIEIVASGDLVYRISFVGGRYETS